MSYRFDTYHIYDFDLDMYGRTSILALCKYLQTSASYHAQELGFGFAEMENQNTLWVLSRFRIIFDHFPALDDIITIKTWPSSFSRLFALREYHLFDQTNRTLARATSYWLVLDKTTRKPKRPQSVFLPTIALHNERVLDESLEKLEQPDQIDQTDHYQVRFSDLDLNRHVNFLTYIRWIYNSYSPQMYHDQSIQSLEINYLAECFLHDDITVQSGVQNRSEHYRHAIVRSHNQEPVCLGSVIWRKL